MNVAPAPTPTRTAVPPATHGPRVSARERLLAAADELFYENGVNLVGIDRVIEHAGVAKASLYDSFGSKEELIRCYLQGRNERRQARIRERMAQFQAPRDKILSVFDSLAEMVARPNYHGCAFQRVGAEAGAGSSIKRICDESRAWLRDQLIELAREAGARDPQVLGGQLALIYDGAAVTAYLDQNPAAVQVARAVAEQLLSAAG